MAKLNPVDASTSKPHPFSKEWRALRAAQEWANVTEIPSITPVVETQTVKNQDPTMKAILERLERQEAELKALKSKDDGSMYKDAKAKYEWPRHYSFSLWAGIPVLGWESFRKDPTLDFEYMNDRKVWVTNHYMRLKLADGTEVEVTNYNFNRDKKLSDKMPAKVMTNELWETHYTFHTETWGDITILSSNFLN